MRKTIYTLLVACLLLTSACTAFAQKHSVTSIIVNKYLNEMEAKYNELDLLSDGVTFTKYMTYDFDGDGKQEFWMSSENDENQAIFSLVNGKLELLSHTYFKTNFFFFPGVIASSGSCGTGCYGIEYTVLRNSLKAYTLNEMQSYNFEKDTMESEYTKNDKDISRAEGERIVKSYGKSIDVERKMHKITRR